MTDLARERHLLEQPQTQSRRRVMPRAEAHRRLNQNHRPRRRRAHCLRDGPGRRHGQRADDDRRQGRLAAGGPVLVWHVHGGRRQILAAAKMRERRIARSAGREKHADGLVVVVNSRRLEVIEIGDEQREAFFVGRRLEEELESGVVAHRCGG